MRVDPSRLLQTLSAERGFGLGLRKADRFSLVRPSALDGLFEHVLISASGTAGQALACDVAVSIVRSQLGTKGMCELETLTELATDPERGVAIIETAEQAREWEAHVVKMAPAAASALALREGPALLGRTSKARSAVARYLTLLGRERPLDELERWLSSRATAEQLNKAKQLAQAPGILWKNGDSLARRVATLAVVVHAESVEDNGSELLNLDRSPEPLKLELPRQELVWRVHLLADRLTQPEVAAPSR